MPQFRATVIKPSLGFWKALSDTCGDFRMVIGAASQKWLGAPMHVVLKSTFKELVSLWVPA